jgi:hypothetical protein
LKLTRGLRVSAMYWYMRPGPWCTTSGSAPLAGLRDPPRAAALLTGQAGLRESPSEVIWRLLARDSEGPSPSVALGAIPNAAASRVSFRVVAQNRTKSGKGHSVPVTGPWCMQREWAARPHLRLSHPDRGDFTDLSGPGAASSAAGPDGFRLRVGVST